MLVKILIIMDNASIPKSRWKCLSGRIDSLFFSTSPSIVFATNATGCDWYSRHALRRSRAIFLLAVYARNDSASFVGARCGGRSVLSWLENMHKLSDWTKKLKESALSNLMTAIIVFSETFSNNLTRVWTHLTLSLTLRCIENYESCLAWIISVLKACRCSLIITVPTSCS